MIFLSSVKFNVISHVTEDENLVKQCIINCLHPDIRGTKITIQKLQSQFMDSLNIYSVMITRKEEVEMMIEYLTTKIENLDVLDRYFDQNIDHEEKTLHFRLDKFKAMEDTLEISKGSDIIKCELSYNTYEQHENTIDNVRRLYTSSGFIK